MRRNPLDALWNQVLKEYLAPPQPKPKAKPKSRNGVRRGRLTSGRKRACTLLREKLARGAVPETEIAIAVRAADIQQHDLLAACDDMGVVAQHGCWRLPE